MLNNATMPVSRASSIKTWQSRLGSALGAALLTLGLVACGGGGGTQDTAAREAPKSLIDPSAPLTGAVFTTDVGCAGVNINIFDSKDAVYLDGGPRSESGSGLPDGTYWVKVTDPSGATLLGSTPTDSVKVVNGKFVQCYQLSAILVRPISLLPGYDDTPNNGGEYKVWVSPENDFVKAKTDNFKVRAQDPNCAPNCPPTDPSHLIVKKFYDANANGVKDPLEVYLPDWKMTIQPLNLVRFTTVNLQIDPGVQYTVTEGIPLEAGWFTTTPNPQTATALPLTTVTLEFGNLCVGAGGGLTLGFWSNKNGQALVGATDLAMLVALNLKNGSGADFNPGNYAALRTWLLNGTAVNMAYMLSVQLAAMELNVFNGIVNGGALVHAPGATSANLLGFASISNLMAEANAELALHPNTTAINSFRSYQEALKNALDKANNNLNFVQATACAYTFN